MHPWELSVEPLPFTTPPIVNETTTSYIRRLAAINNWPAELLLDHIASHQRQKTTPRRDDATHDLALNRLAIARLAAISGHPASALHRALNFGPHPPPSESTRPQGTWHVVRSSRTSRHIRVKACPRCVTAKNIPATPTIYLSADRPFCRRHRLWLADQPNGHPINLVSHPGLFRTAKRHLRLHAERGAQPAATAIDTARQLWFNYRHNAKDHNPLQQRWAQRHARLTPDLTGNVLVTRYPEIIVLATMITSPHWLSAAMQPYHPRHRRWITRTRPDERDFLTELANRINHPNPDRFITNPGSLRRWALHNRQIGQLE